MLFAFFLKYCTKQGNAKEVFRRNKNVSDSPNHQSATALVAADLPYGTWMEADPSWLVEPWLPWLAGEGGLGLYVETAWEQK